MNYIKPELNIKKFEITENVTEDYIISATADTPPWYEDDTANIGNIGGEIFEEVFNNIIGI